jgi:hypothetical protein
MARRQGGTVIGMTAIKERRLRLAVKCHSELHVGDCVPFYFCPRSIMLFVIHCANNSDLSYRGGQEPIVHLEADMHRLVQWAEANGRRWAFSLSNAAASYAQFRKELDQLNEINWTAVAATDFRSADIKEGKQAEFLVEQSCPWHLIERIGVLDRATGLKVSSALSGVAHRPQIEIMRRWYY